MQTGFVSHIQFWPRSKTRSDGVIADIANSYCSSECQKKDWKASHKKMCPQLATVNEFSQVAQGQTPSPRNWKDYREEMVCILGYKLGLN
jgi:hypothetical protein